ncbi:hypothetical protein [Waltera sp.]|uniref:hypothetical protein n=1 Tax=Waltera sp. TaxID=2815806 RepID=UPI003AB97588
MSEQTYMYEQETAVAALHQVEGFDPRKFMRLIQKEDQSSRYYLDVAYRKLWFRLCYPEGKIVKTIRSITEKMAIVEAKVYLSKNDPEDSYVANAFAQKYRMDDSEIGQKYVELAETAAVGRALSDAGFGLQFADREKEMDPEVTEAPIDEEVMAGTPICPENIPEEVFGSSVGENLMEDMIPGQCGIEDYIPMPDEIMQVAEASKEEAQQPKAAQQPTKKPEQTPQEQFMQNNVAPEATVGITRDMPVNDIYGKLTRDLAVKVVVSAGCYKGKTLGQIAVEKPGSLQWYVDSYKGPDNLLRAAAKYLLDQALAPAC